MVTAPIVYFDSSLDDALGGSSATYHRGSGAASTPESSTGAPSEQLTGGLRFNGQDTFAYLPHSEDLEVQNGTVALWVRPQQLRGEQVFVSKDESGQDDGGHFYIGMEDGKLTVRFAPGDGGWNKSWETVDPVFEAGVWSHVAVSFGADGVHIYVDGEELPASGIVDQNGEAADPADYYESHLLTNDKPIVLGAATYWSEDVSSPAVLAENGLHHHFNGDIDGFGMWGGTGPEAALDATEIAALAAGEPVSFTPAPEAPIDRTNDIMVGTDGVDVLDGGYGDDEIDGGAGIDVLQGGYGDDHLKGGDGADQLNGGRGSDLLEGGAGDDLIILGSDAGEPKLGQTYDPAENPDGELNPETLTVFQGHPLVGDDIAIGGEGADTFVLQPQLNAKRDIILKHQKDDRSINWKGVAGENEEHHDHWPDSIGIDIIADYDKSEGDKIVIDGHTANIEVKGGGIEYRDVNGDGVEESIITIVSNQPNGGAHDQDLLGRVTVFGDRVEVDDIRVDAGSVAGIIETVEDLEEAINPEGVYDDNPDRYNSLNPFLDQVDFAAVNDDPEVEYQEIVRPVAVEKSVDNNMVGTDSSDVMYGDRVVEAQATDPHPPISYFGFDSVSSGVFEDARGVQSLAFYKAVDAKAVLQSGPGEVVTEAGAPGLGGRALRFEENDQFAVVEHDEAYEVLQGTVGLWFKADDVNDGDQTLIAKDESGSGDGGHMRVMIQEGGQLFIRMASGDGRSNREWVSKQPLIESGEWTHVAVGFGQDGIEVWLDGQRLNDNAFEAVTTDTPALSDYKEYFLVTNEQPWVLGADTFTTPDADSAAAIAAEDRLTKEFKGAIDGFGVWGGMSPEDKLNDSQVASLVANGPGDLDAPARVPTAVPMGDDDMRGFGGDDEMHGGAGRDVMDGGEGNDELYGGYGADRLMGSVGADFLDGGHGNDILHGGGGDDILLSRADGREGPVTLDPFRDEGDPYNELSPINGQVYESQPVTGANDVLTGGAGADTFRFETLINTKERYFLDHVMENGMIHWHGVAGENDEIHDHWVDILGHDVITDYSVEEGDVIEVVGHTTQIFEVEYVDEDNDGTADYSVIYVYSQQGNGGGAHDEDQLGTITVYGDLVEEDDIVSDANPAYGIVDTVWELEEAITPLYTSDEQARDGFRTEETDPGTDPGAGDGGGNPNFNRIFGDSTSQELRGGDESDWMNGMAGDDQMWGGGSRDRMGGGTGDDMMYGGEGNDLVAGSAGDDSIWGNMGNDVLRGGEGADTLYGDAGEDFMGGGAGADTMYGGADNDKATGGAGNDWMDGGAGDDLMVGAVGDDIVMGGGGNDILAGRTGDDALFGGAGDDTLFGNAGVNTINGGAGDDDINVAQGQNTLIYDDANFGNDEVYGFDVENDAIEILSSVVADTDMITIEAIADNRTQLSFGEEGGTVTLYGVNAADLTPDVFKIVDQTSDSAAAATEGAGGMSGGIEEEMPVIVTNDDNLVG